MNYKAVGLAAKQKLWAISGLLTGAVTWGVIWYPLRLLQQAGISGAMSSLTSYLLALLLGLIFLPGALREIRRAPAILLWIALSSGWANLAYVLAVIHGEVMRVLLLFYLAPLWTVVFARLLLAERLNATGWRVMLLAVCGAAVMLWQPSLGWPLPKNGAEWLGLSAGVMFALTNVLTRYAHSHSIHLKSFSVWAGVSVLSAIALVYQPPAPGVLQALSVTNWVWLLALGVLVYAATLVMQYGLTHMPANQAIVILLFELVVAAISAYYLAGETMTLREWAGGVMIVAASLFSGRLERK